MRMRMDPCSVPVDSLLVQPRAACILDLNRMPPPQAIDSARRPLPRREHRRVADHRRFDSLHRRIVVWLPAEELAHVVKGLDEIIGI